MSKPSVERAVELTFEGKHDAALEVYACVLEGDPGDLDAYGHRAWLLISLGRYEDAIRDYDSLLERNPGDTEAALQRAAALGKTRDFERAIAALRQVLERDPRSLRALDVWRKCVEDTAPAPAEPPPRTLELSRRDARPLNPVIEALESEPASFPASVFPEVGQLLYSLVRSLRPRAVVETGCYVGYSTLCIAQALEENDAGHVHSFDLFLDLSADYRSPVLGACRDALEVARTHLERANLAHRVTFHKGDSSLGIAECFRDASQAVDFAFIDGDHTVKGCFKDWNAVLGLLRPGAVAVLHDTDPEDCGWVGPNALLDECRKRPAEFQALDLPTPEGFGLGLVQKIADGGDRKWDPPIAKLVKEFIQMAIWRLRR